MPIMDAFRRRTFESGTRLLFESILIVLSVALGFAVTEWRQNRADRQLVARVLENVRTEVELNLAQIEQQISRHQQMIKEFESADVSDPRKSAWDITLEIMMKMGGGMDTLPLRQGAWNAAVSSGALRLMDYDIAAAMSDIYVGPQESYTITTQQAIPAIFTPDTFRPGSQREALQVIRWLIVEVEGRERFVRDIYKRYLPRLREAG
jgi:hypothetical protein